MALSIVNQIKDAVLGVKSNKIDAIIDDSISRIEKFSQTEDKNKFLDAMKKLISVSGADGNSLIKSLSTGSPQVQQYDNSGRISRYAEYDAICAKIPYCERALQCWVDHIVSPDEILKTSLQICPNDRDNRDNDVSVALGRLNSISKHFEIEHKIRGIIKTTLKKGDNFLEIVKTPEGANSLVVLNEAVDPTVFDDFKTVLSKSYPLEIKNVIHEGKKEIVETTKRKIKVVIDEAASSLNLLGGVFTGMTTNLGSPSYPNFPSQYTDVTGVVNNGKSKDKGNSNSAAQYVDDDEFKSNFDKIEKDANKYEIGEDRMKLGDLSLVIHDPKYVIKLETLRFRVCLGYLVFPKVDLINVQSGVINNIDSMCAQLLNDVKQKLSTKIKVSDKLNITDDIKKVLMAHLQHISKNDDLKIRYVNPDLMQHFKLESQKYAPYGESIFDSVLFNCRMYIAQKTACLVKQINASTDKRFISLEIGLPRDAQNVIAQMKESLNKKRVTVDSLGNTDTIPSQISTWENVFIPMKDGKKYVEIDHQQWAPSANDDVETLKNAAEDICGNLGVPAEYLGMQQCLPYSTKIKLLDNTDIEIGKLVELWEQNENNRNVWVYSIDTETSRIVPGKITNVYRTRKNAEIVRVWLDNGEYVDSTPDHRYMLRDGTYCEARDLKPDTALMPLYTQTSKALNRTRNFAPYFEVYNPETGKFELVHRMVCERLNRVVSGSGLHVHHIDRNPGNNHPDNLLVCTREEHNRIHSHLKNRDMDGNILYENLYRGLIETRNCVCCGKAFECKVQSTQKTCHSRECDRKFRSELAFERWMNYAKLNPEKCSQEVVCKTCGKKFKIPPNVIKKYKDGNHFCCRECMFEYNRQIGLIKRNSHYHDEICEICGKTFKWNDRNLTKTCSLKCTNTLIAKKRWNSKCHGQTIQCTLCGKPMHVADWYMKQNEYFACDSDICKRSIKCLKTWLRNHPEKTISDYCEWKGIKPYNYKNHKVVRIEYLQERQDCYDIEIEKYHNFGLSAGIFVHNSGNRATLTSESINFARGIISRQQELTPCLHGFYTKVYSLVWGIKAADVLKKIQITFQLPRIAPMSVNIEFIENSQRAIEALSQLGLSKEYLKRQFMPYIDWDKAESDSIKQKISQETGEEAPENGGLDLGGMGMIPTGGAGMDMSLGGGGLGGM